MANSSVSVEARRAAAALLVVGFPERAATPQLRALLDAGVSGVVLFARNFTPDSDPAQARSLTAEIKAARTDATLLCLDQEGGRVQRLRGPFTTVPSMRAIGATGDPALARDAGRVLGRECRWAGFDVDFAPSVDVDTNPANPVIATRSFGPDPAAVAAMAVPLIHAMQAERVAACAKHFPGHGDTSTDSHHALPRLDHPMSRLEAVELPPFAAAITACVASLMSAHVIFTPLDPLYPATMSRKSLGDIVRGRFAFDGVVFSDDLEMKAVADHYALEDQLLKGHEAGLDLFTICHSLDLQHRAIEILAAAISRGTLDPTASLRRIARLKTHYCAGIGPGTLEDLQRDHAPERARLASLTAGAVAGIDPTKFK